MANTKRRFNIAGFTVTLAASERRTEQIRSHALYRYLLRPAISAVRGGVNQANRSRNGVHTARSTFDPSRLTGEAAKVWKEVSKLKWYHSIDVGHGIITPGFVDERSVVDKYGLPEDLTGMRALDVGTYDGFWAFEMERRGADEVIGIDVDSPEDYDIPRQRRMSPAELNALMERVKAQIPGDGLRLATKLLNSRVERKSVNVYDLSPKEVGMVDIAFVSEVMLHLRDPETALENIFSVLNPGGMLIIGEPYQPELEEFERPISEFKGAVYWGIWWSFSPLTLRCLLEVAGFDPIEEISRMHLYNPAGEFDKVVFKAHVPPQVRSAAGES